MDIVYDNDMKPFLLGVTVLSIILTIGAFLIPINKSAIVPTQQVLGATKTQLSFELSAYLDQKFEDIKPEKTFGDLAQNFSALITKRVYAASGSAEVEDATESANKSPTLAAKSNYTIGFVGDSMIDTLGANMPEVAAALKARFPSIKFKLLNYGAGATNIESAENRLHNSFNYLGVTKPPLLSEQPDVIVLESFAYNHWNNSQGDLDRQWLAIAHLMDFIKAAAPNSGVILATAVGPYCPTYTDGSANLPPERKYIECETVKAYLQNMVNFAIGQKYPLADAYHASLSGKDGNPKYINAGDHIHPSEAGKRLFGEKVADALSTLLQSENNRPAP